MRHLTEVVLALEGKQKWAKVLRDRRSEEGLPLPSIRFDAGNGDKATSSELLEVLVKGIDQALMSKIVSFI